MKTTNNYLRPILIILLLGIVFISTGADCLKKKDTTSGSSALRKPTGIWALHTAGGAVQIGWEDNSGNESGFQIRRRNGGSGIAGIQGTKGA